MTIHITGDTHGEVSRLIDYNKTNPGDIIIITGDFGMLWRRNDFTKISKLNKAAEEKNITYLFCDGNHENFELLEACPEEEKYGGKVGKISKYIYHLKRGEIYTIEDKTFFVFGGASSIDRMYRTPYVSWWPHELPSSSEINNAYNNLERINFNPEYIITHTAPTLFLKSIRGFQVINWPDAAQDVLNDLVQKIAIENPNYKHWYFGHFHIDRFSRKYKFHALYQSWCVLK